jgi:hypothetical protein
MRGSVVWAAATSSPGRSAAIRSASAPAAPSGPAISQP